MSQPAQRLAFTYDDYLEWNSASRSATNTCAARCSPWLELPTGIMKFRVISTRCPPAPSRCALPG